MRSLSVIAPGPQALQMMIAAHERMTRAQLEAQTGDAVTAEASQGMLMGSEVGESFGFGGLGLRGAGGGGGGMGYGRGAGRLGSRRARAPRIRTGRASVSMSGSLRGLVREEFPGTLHFVPTMPVHASGTTPVTIPLAHAATTYLVEVVHWRPDGWVWSTTTRVRVDQDLVGRRPRASLRHRGRCDSIAPPRGQPHELADGCGALGSSRGRARARSAHDSRGDDRAQRLERRRGGADGAWRVRSSTCGRALPQRRRRHPADRSRFYPTRGRVSHEVDRLLADGRPLVLDVPQSARPRRGGRVIVTTGHAMFASHGEWLGWAQALRGRPSREAIGDAADRVGNMFDEEDGRTTVYGEPLEVALTLSVLWNTRALSENRLRAMLTNLTEALVVSEPRRGADRARRHRLAGARAGHPTRRSPRRGRHHLAQPLPVAARHPRTRRHRVLGRTLDACGHGRRARLDRSSAPCTRAHSTRQTAP